MPIRKRKTVTRTKTYDYHSPSSKFYTSGRTKSVVVKGKDGTVKRTKNVQKSYSNKYGGGDAYLAAKGRTPALVTKTRKKKDGTTVTKTISRRGTKNNLKYDPYIKEVSGSVDKSKRKVTKQIQSNVNSRGAFSPKGAVGSKKRTVTKTKATPTKKAIKSVVVKGKDGTVKKTKDVFKSPSKSYGPTLVTKSKKNKDGTITNKDISRGILKRDVRKRRDFPLPETKDNMFE